MGERTLFVVEEGSLNPQRVLLFITNVFSFLLFSGLSID